MPPRLRKAPKGLPPVHHGPWVGVRNVSDPYEEAPNLLYDALNAYIPDPERGSGISIRPPINAIEAGGILGNTGRYGQRVHDHTRDDGTIDRFVFVAGKMYRWNGSASAPVFTDLTPTNVTISTTGRIYCTSFADRLIVNDGVNPPWSYNPATAVATRIVAETTVPPTLLSRGVPDTTLAVAAFAYVASGTIGTKTATATLTLPVGITVSNGFWAAYRVSANASGALAVAGVGGLSTYGTEAAAIAAMPAAPTGSFDVGYVTVRGAAGGWIAGTDALQGGVTGTPAGLTNYYAPPFVQWSAYGQPVVYGAKLFFIVSTIAGIGARSTIVWSEEAAPLTGYQQPNYDNAWDLTQTSSEALYCLVATNAALYYLRQRSIGAITGAVSSTFATSATQDAVSTTIGTTTPASVLLAENFIYFANEDGLPHRFAIGSREIEAIWLNLRDATTTASQTATVRTSHPTCAIAAYQPELRLVVMAIWASSASVADTATTLYIFSASSGTYQGTWEVGNTAGIDTLGLCRDDTNRYLLCAIGATDASTSAQTTATRGAFFIQRRAGDMSVTVPWSDVTATTLPFSITTGELLGDAMVDKAFDLLSVRCRASVGSLIDLNRAMTITYDTPRVTGGGSLAAPLSQGVAEDRRAIVGTGATGRWAKFTISGPSSGAGLSTESDLGLLTEADELIATDVALIGPFTIEAVDAVVYATGDDPVAF